MKKAIATALLTPLLAFGINSIAAAQESDTYNQANPAAQEQPATPDFSEADLKKYASAQERLEVIRGDYSNRAQAAQAAQDTGKLAELQKEATQKMVQAVNEADLEVEIYNQIAMAVQNDPELRSRVQSLR